MLQSMGLQRVRHNGATELMAVFTLSRQMPELTVVSETGWLTESKMCPLWPFTETVC